MDTSVDSARLRSISTLAVYWRDAIACCKDRASSLDMCCLALERIAPQQLV